MKERGDALRMTESDVIRAVVKHLEADGWTIKSTCTEKQTGIDLKAERGNEGFVLEAKGGTSRKEGTGRYGKGFTTNQQRDHVANALLTALKLHSSEPKSQVAIAFPDTPSHRRHITAAADALKTLSIWAYVIHPDQRVERIV
ncbi:MAG TPA: hypothetical protein VGG51_13775 [Candidatus Cybelea sp.]